VFEALYVTHTPVEQVCARFSMTPVAIYCFRTLRAFMSGSCSTIWPSVRALHARALADGAAVSDIIVNGRGTMIYLTAPELLRGSELPKAPLWPGAAASRRLTSDFWTMDGDGWAVVRRKMGGAGAFPHVRRADSTLAHSCARLCFANT